MNKFKIHFPVDTLIVTQDFGSTAFIEYYKKNGLTLPGHNGIDYALQYGTPIYAAHDGIAYYEVDDKQGHGVVVRTEKEYEYGTGSAFFKSIYWHMIDGNKDPKFKSPIMGTTINSGKRVKAGDLIGYADSTGLSTGNHLHFGIKPCAINEPPNTWYNLEQGNGMYGAIDPRPYLSGFYASDIVTVPFNVDMKLGDVGDEVVRLQKFLSARGYFNAEKYPRYGEMTRNALYLFQLDFVPLSWYERVFMKGKNFGPKTRAIINNMIGSQ